MGGLYLEQKYTYIIHGYFAGAFGLAPDDRVGLCASQIAYHFRAYILYFAYSFRALLDGPKTIKSDVSIWVKDIYILYILVYITWRCGVVPIYLNPGFTSAKKNYPRCWRTRALWPQRVCVMLAGSLTILNICAQPHNEIFIGVRKCDKIFFYWNNEFMCDIVLCSIKWMTHH